jgi:uncharacterized protein YozE (UPF0346 family)
MPTSREYRLRAEQCLKLAELAEELYTQIALAELADEYEKAADYLENRASGPAPSN